MSILRLMEAVGMAPRPPLLYATTNSSLRPLLALIARSPHPPHAVARRGSSSQQGVSAAEVEEAAAACAFLPSMRSSLPLLPASSFATSRPLCLSSHYLESSDRPEHARPLFRTLNARQCGSVRRLPPRQEYQAKRRLATRMLFYAAIVPQHSSGFSRRSASQGHAAMRPHEPPVRRANGALRGHQRCRLHFFNSTSSSL